MNLADLATRLEGFRKTGRGYMAKCPAHEDRKASLSLRDADGKILVFCHAGCPLGRIVDAMGLEIGDLFLEPSPPKANTISATYDYRDESGTLLFQVLRYANKDFRQRAPDPTGAQPWIYQTRGIRRVPYRLPDLLAAGNDAPFFVVEGEKDANRLASLGLCATTNAGGAGKFSHIDRPALDCFTGRTVYILPDNDGPGREHAAQVAKILLGIASTIRICELPGLPPKGDVSDFLDSGGTLERLITLCRNGQLYDENTLTISAGTDSVSTDERLTDLGNAKRLQRLLGDEMRYVPGWGWMIWDGKRWEKDTTQGHKALYYCARAVEAIQHEAAECPDKDFAELLRRHGTRSENGTRLKIMRDIAESLPALRCPTSTFDRNPMLFNLTNGTLNLETGTLAPHRKEDFITKLSPATYDPKAACPRFEQFLREIMAGDTDLVGFLQRIAGYCLTGSVREHAVFIFYGTGANGKSTFVETLRNMLGDYAKSTEQSTFLVRQQEGVRNDLAALVGARLVTTNETEGGKRLDEGLIKAAAGGDPITARFLYAELFEFYPQFKVILSTNHRPVIRGVDEGIWRRIHLIPFETTIPEDQRDKDLGSRLQAEQPGIARWAVQGLDAWLRYGIASPVKVKLASRQYRSDMDQFGSWISDCGTVSEHARASSRELFQSYTRYCEDRGEHALGMRSFTTALMERGFTRTEWHASGIRIRGWKGISLDQSKMLANEPPSHLHGFDTDTKATTDTIFDNSIARAREKKDFLEKVSVEGVVSANPETSGAGVFADPPEAWPKELRERFERERKSLVEQGFSDDHAYVKAMATVRREERDRRAQLKLPVK